MAVQVKQEDAYAFAELLELLGYMAPADTNKIPKKLMTIFENYALPTYEKHLNPAVPFNQQLTPKTVSYLGILCVNYWCENEEEKNSLLNKVHQNDLRREEELRQKYSYENMFNNTKSEDESLSSQDILSTDNQLEQSSDASSLPIDYNNFPWYKKVFTKIKNFFYKLFNKANNPT